MTWQEFKAWVDTQLAEKGISPDTPIWFIDVSFPDRADEEIVVAEDTCGIMVC